jgi:hypothetical protein
MLTITHPSTRFLLSDEYLLTQVRLALVFGASKRAIGRRLGLNWKQVDLLVAHVQGKGVMV